MIKEFELQSGNVIEEFCIGKTYAEARKLKNSRHFNSMDVKTWKLGGISSRWSETDDDYKVKGYDGLVAIGAVTRAMLKTVGNRNVWDQQLYAPSQESTLISHFAFEACDLRLANKSLHPGHLQNVPSAGYVLYFAYRYKDQEEEDVTETTEEPEETLVRYCKCLEVQFILQQSMFDCNLFSCPWGADECDVTF